MDALKLHFTARDRDDLPLAIGVNGLGRKADGDARLGPVHEDVPSVVRFCVDRRGVWMTVAEGARGVHVNGREVRRMAMLRVGDAIYVDGMEMRLLSEREATLPPSLSSGTQVDADDDPRTVLRGVGGQYHGRSFTLEQPRLVGSARDADIRIDDPAFAERHARIELLGDQVLLRDVGSAEGSEVNGVTVRDAVLLPGDQIVFDAHHRFVVEAPARAATLRGYGGYPPSDPVQEAGDGAQDHRRPWHKLPWLLLAALLLAASLSALLLFGAG